MESSEGAMAYHIPLALTILSSVFLALGAIFAIVVAADIIVRRGWRSMMGIMIPVYIINATYLGPVTLYLYYRFGRPQKPQKHDEKQPPEKLMSVSSDASVEAELEQPVPACHARQDLKSSADEPATGEMSRDEKIMKSASESQSVPTSCCKSKTPEPEKPPSSGKGCCESQSAKTQHSSPTPLKPSCCEKEVEKGLPMHDEPNHATGGVDSTSHPGGGHACHSSARRPTWATILIGVSHCGAGCVLGDLVGEWLVYGTGAMINGHSVWAELLIDYAFALLFGIIFQYFSIAPMSGAWGPMTVWRAFKADVVSLTSFEVGAFGWMIAFQVGIFGYKVGMDTWLYWWMMQVGMALGACTGFPVNYWLIKHQIKEPCC